MSQASGTTGEGAVGSSLGKASTGRAVLLLAIAVILGITLLNTLDTESTKTSVGSSSAPAQHPSTTSVPSSNQVATQARPPSEVKVLVANGVGAPGVASKVAGRLQPAGYQLLKPGNTTNKELSSFVQFAPGYQPEAQALATSLGLPASAVQALPNPSPVTDLQGANVLVIVGNDLANAPQTQAAQPQVGTSNQGRANVTATTVGPLTNLPAASNSSPASGASPPR